MAILVDKNSKVMVQGITGEAASPEWSVCGGPQGNAGYAKARATVAFRSGED